MIKKIFTSPFEDSFNTFGKHKICGWYIPMITGVYMILIAFFLFYEYCFSVLSRLCMLYGTGFVFSAIADIIFFILNRKSFTGWKWYLFYIFFFCGSGFFFCSNNTLITLFIIGLVIALRFIFYMGISIDLQKNRYSQWEILAINSFIGIVITLLFIINNIIPILVFIILGISSILFSLEMKKINKFYRQIHKLEKNKIKNN